MFQKFFEDTLISRFIKRLLRSTNIPLLHFVYEDSEILEGCLYIYKNYVIRCIESGKFYVNPQDALYPSDNIYPSVYLFPSIYIKTDSQEDPYTVQGNYKVAKYIVIKYYDENDMQIHYNFHSKFMYYDSDTHFHLGEYLRYLRDRKNLDLFPYYNCFSNKSINRIHLVANSTDGRTFKLSRNTDYKLYAVPIKFGQKYTIAIDSDTPVQLRTLIYNDDSGCILKDTKTKESEKAYYSDDIDDYECLPTSSFTKPFLKYIKPADTQELYAQEKNLYLIIQVSKENNSAVTVIEGDYTKSWNKVISNAEKYSEYSFHKNLSLLHFNSHTSFAFSDRLIEYLLLNVINHTEEIDGNIEYVQKLITNNDPEYQFPYKGIWTDNIRLDLHHIENKLLENRVLRDLDGYLNKDLENILSKGVI
ncbi:MAG: hypothetical protein J6R47_04575 [Acholeplasmatales bacterium]|nr:hypothetical protein [Acholeplasmatales bacterium]